MLVNIFYKRQAHPCFLKFRLTLQFLKYLESLIQILFIKAYANIFDSNFQVKEF
jgi:hypothetical protein